MFSDGRKRHVTGRRRADCRNFRFHGLGAVERGFGLVIICGGVIGPLAGVVVYAVAVLVTQSDGFAVVVAEMKDDRRFHDLQGGGVAVNAVVAELPERLEKIIIGHRAMEIRFERFHNILSFVFISISYNQKY